MWVKLTDLVAQHPKLLAAGAEAAWLWVAGLCYANAHVTDGHIPARALAALYPCDDWTGPHRKRLAARLVEVGLWVLAPDGWSIYHYERYQAEAMTDATEERRERERLKKAAQRAAKKAAKSGVGSPQTRGARSNDFADLPSLSPGDRGGTVPGDIEGDTPGDRARDTQGTRPRDNSARARGTVSPPPDPSRPVPVSPNGDTHTARVRDGERAPTVEHQGLRAEELIAALRSRARGTVLTAGGGDSRVALELQRAVTALAVGPLGATRGDLDTLADWYAAGALAWRTTRPLSVRDLAAPGVLAEHVEQALAWHRAGRPRITHGAAPSTARPQGASRRVGPAPASSSDDFAAEAGKADPLADFLHKPTGT